MKTSGFCYTALWFVLLTSCSQNTSSVAGCARTQAVAVEKSFVNKSVVTSLNDVPGYPGLKYGTFPGGILTLSSRLTAAEAKILGQQGAQIKETRCTFMLGANVSQLNGNAETLLWTADHCMVPGRDTKATLDVWLPGSQKYETTEVQIDRLKIHADFQKSLVLLPEVAQNAAFSFMEKDLAGIRDASTAVCSKASVISIGQGKSNTLCTSLADLSAFKFEFVQKPSDELAQHLSSSMSYMSDLQRNIKFILSLYPATANITAEVSNVLVNWAEYSLQNSYLKKNLSFASLAAELSGCVADTGATGRPLCEFSQQLSQNSFLSPYIGRTGNSEANTKKSITVQIDKNHLEMSAVLNAIEKEQMIASVMMLASNWDFVRNTSGLETNKILDPATAGGFGSMIAKTLEPTGAVRLQIPLIDGKKTVFVVVFPEGVKPFRFLAGDSGTTISLLGVIPMFTLSTVDGEPTTGGIAFRKLPTSKEDRNQKGQGTAESKKTDNSKKTAQTNANCIY